MSNFRSVRAYKVNRGFAAPKLPFVNRHNRPVADIRNMSRIAADQQRRYPFRLQERLDECQRTMQMIAAFSVGLFYVPPKAHFKTMACEPCYESALLLSGKPLWIKQNSASL